MRFLLGLGAALVSATGVLAADPALAPTGVLRAAYLAGNPVQASIDPRTGEVRGVAVDLAHELARTADARLDLFPVEGVQGVIAAVRDGRADVGFLAADPSREGPIRFSNVYLRNPQGLVTPAGSPIKAIEDLSAPGLRIGVTRGDSIALYLARNRPNLRLVEIDTTNVEAARALLRSGQVDGFAGNRLRLQQVAADGTDLTLLRGSIMGVPQAMIVPAAEETRLDRLNAFLSEVRRNGFLESSISRAANGAELEALQ